MRHQAHHIALFINNPGNIIERSIRIRLTSYISFPIAIAKDYLPVRFEIRKDFLGHDKIPFAVRDRNAKNVGRPPPAPSLKRRRRIKSSVIALGVQINFLARKFQRFVPNEHAWQESALAEYLKSVADTKHRAAFVRIANNIAHDWREPRDGARPQIIAIGKSARQNDEIDIFPNRIGFMPNEFGIRLAEHKLHGVHRVVIAIRAGENDDAGSHNG